MIEKLDRTFRTAHAIHRREETLRGVGVPYRTTCAAGDWEIWIAADVDVDERVLAYNKANGPDGVAYLIQSHPAMSKELAADLRANQDSIEGARKDYLRALRMRKTLLLAINRELVTLSTLTEEARVEYMSKNVHRIAGIDETIKALF